MNRGEWLNPQIMMHLPHARGDEPYTSVNPANDSQFAPRTRG